MAVNFKGRTMGCSYYDVQLSKLFVMQDMIECNAAAMIEIVKSQVRPTLILINTRLDESVVEVLKLDCTGREPKIEVRPSGDFSYSMAKAKLISVWISIKRSQKRRFGEQSEPDDKLEQNQPPLSEMNDSTQREAQSHLSNAIDLQSTESVACAGALIGFITRHEAPHRIVGGGQSTMIMAIGSFSMDAFMFINPNSLSSLQIFEDETHPSMHNSIRGRKEGLSVYGILNQTKTPQGRYLLKQWLLRPSLDLNVIIARHKAVECFVRTDNQHIVKQLVSYLSHIKNMSKVLQALPRNATLTGWQSILQFVYYSLKIYNDVQGLYLGELYITKAVRNKAVEEKIAKLRENTLDFDESMIEGRCVVKHNVDEELDRMRSTYHGLDSFLSECAREISATIPSEFTSTINVIYFPQLGYLITVPLNPNWKTEQDFYLEGLTFQVTSTLQANLFIYSRLIELDEHIGDIHGLIVDREIEILQSLQERILEYSELLVTCSNLCAELDVLVSFAQVARLRSYHRPIMTDENVLHITNGRHPLQELVVNSFVPNDTQLGELYTASSTRAVASTAKGSATEHLIAEDIADVRYKNDPLPLNNQVMLLSGANSSGKSVYLKQVALITYMAHIGSFVPAESAVVGLTDKILTRLQTRETVSSIQSAFMTDLQQVSMALKHATKRSLVILDEFGKGTISTDGAGMFCGVIEHFAKRTHDRPRVLATTHFHECFENHLLNLSLPISLYTMEVLQGSSGLEVTFLFRVIPGKTPSSLGPTCAAMAGMPASIVQRGIELSTLFRRYEKVIPVLTERETAMQRMYEQLTGMLLHLDLDKDLDMLSDDNDNDDENRGKYLPTGLENGIVRELPTHNLSVHDTIAIQGTETETEESNKDSILYVDGNISKGSGVGRKRKRRDNEGAMKEKQRHGG
ncbi:DNA mismatch repair protein MutS, partial [Lobosporangium transversale]